MTRRTSRLVIALGLVFGAAATAVAQAPRVLVWDASLQGEDESAVTWPVAVAAGPDDEVAVADVHTPKLVIFRREGTAWSVVHTARLPATPLDMVYDGTRYVLSLRQAPGLLAVEGPDRKLRNLAPPPRTVPGTLAASTGGTVLVHDLAGNRILRMGPDGDFEVLGPVTGLIAGLTSAPGGGFAAAIPDETVVVRFGPNGQEVGRWTVPGDGPVPAWPSDLVVGSGGKLIVVDRHNSRIVVLDSAGRLAGQGSRKGWDAGLMRFPTAVALLPGGELVVTDTGNGRVQVFRMLDEDPGS